MVLIPNRKRRNDDTLVFRSKSTEATRIPTAGIPAGAGDLASTRSGTKEMVMNDIEESFSQFCGLLEEYGDAESNLATAYEWGSGIDSCKRLVEKTRKAVGEFALKHWKEIDHEQDA